MTKEATVTEQRQMNSRAELLPVDALAVRHRCQIRRSIEIVFSPKAFALNDMQGRILLRLSC